MTKKVIRLTENDVDRLVRKIINESQEELITFIAEIKKQIIHNGALLEDAVDSEDFLVAQNLKQEDSDLREELGKMKKRLKELKNQNE